MEDFMKTVIIALNSKYIHSSLAPWYLKYACGDACGKVKVLEYTINDSIEWILAKIFMEKPDVIAFSCYIWNITQVLKLASNLKKVLPQSITIFGGPEVSFEPEEIMLNNPFIDYIICGEGEVSFSRLLKNLRQCSTKNSYSSNISKKNECMENIDNIGHIGNIDSIYGNSIYDSIKDIEGLCYRDKVEIIYDGKYCLIDSLDSLSSPYTDEMLSTLENKIVYYEASRGCPFSCSYCLSSTFDGVRHFSLERVKKDILRLMDTEVRQVKFVDRTFNCNRKRAKEIIRFIIDNSSYINSDINFHFEAAGDLFDDEMLELLAEAEEGLIQFEIGVQSVNEETLNEIGRKTDTEKVFKNISRLISYGSIHIHLDLIAGLPYEDYSSLQESFNKVYELKPHQLQLGFLKMLKGSRIRNQIKKHGYQFREYPPYEVLYNKYMNFDEMTEFKGIEEIFERYYNSGRFINSLNYVIKKYFDNAFQLYREFYLFNLEAGYLDRALPGRELYTIFYDYIKTIVSTKVTIEDIVLEHELGIVNDLLKFDFLSTNNLGNLPEGIKKIIEPGYKDKRLDFLNDEKNRARYFPEFQDAVPKHLLKYANFVIFEYDITKFIQVSTDIADRVSIDTGTSSDICTDIDSGDFTTADNDIIYNSNCRKSEMFIRKERTVILFNYSHRNKVTGVYEYYKIKF
jgi:radical SAM superfamily enzyme YgiQ (UPF0313 family)